MALLVSIHYFSCFLNSFYHAPIWACFLFVFYLFEEIRTILI
nr:MAG TPA: hypothetical protein [Caudoviricetes sp.]